MAVLRTNIPPPFVRFGFLVVMFFGVVVALGSLIAKHDRWVGAFLIICLFYSVFPNFDMRSGYTLLAVFLGCCWYLFLCEAGISQRVLMNALAAVALLNSAFVILQWLSGNVHFPLVGMMGNINEVSALIGVSLPVFFRKHWRCCLPVILMGLVLSKSFGGFAAAGVGTIVFFFFHGYRFWPAVLVCSAGAAYCVFVDPPGVGVRRILCAMGWEAWKADPMGYGLGHWKTLFNAVRLGDGSIPTMAHNEFIQLLVEAPFTLILIGSYLITKVFQTCELGYGITPKSKDYAIPMGLLAAVVTSCCVHFFFHIAPTAIVGVTIIYLARKRL